MTAVEPTHAPAPTPLAHTHPAWCARGADCADDARHVSHRSRAVSLGTGPYGDDVIAVGLFSPCGLKQETGVSVTVRAHDVDPDGPPDHYIVLWLDEAAALSEMLADAVRQATVPLVEIGATVRLGRAREVLAGIEASERVPADRTLPTSALERQQHVLVPLDLVNRLAAAVDPGTYPVVDPWEEEVAP